MDDVEEGAYTISRWWYNLAIYGSISGELTIESAQSGVHLI